MQDEIIKLVQKYITIPALSDEEIANADLSEHGLDSIKTITLILDLEEYFSIEFPDDMLTFDNLSTIRKISAIVSDLRKQVS